MKTNFLFFGIIFFLIFEIGFISSQESINFSAASTRTGDIAAGNFSADNFTGDFAMHYNPSLDSYNIEPYICGDGICSDGENCSSCLADCGCGSGQTCAVGVCTTTITTVTTGSGGGGGGGPSVVPQKLFSISPEQLNVKIQQGRITTQEITITNNEKTDLTFDVSSSKISDLINIPESTFTLKSGESKVLRIEIMALKNTVPDLYLGNIIFKTTNTEKSILTAIEVVSANNLFDVGVSIPTQFLFVVPGKELYSNVELYNLGESGNTVDVNLEYRILDANGNEILRSTEEVAVNTKMSFTKGFIIPTDAKLGKYVLYVRATYNGLVASASAWFNVGKQTEIPFLLAIIVAVAFIIIAIIANYLNLRKIKKDKITCKVSEYDLRERGFTKK
jgi:hypothetical protein